MTKEEITKAKNTMISFGKFSVNPKTFGEIMDEEPDKVERYINAYANPSFEERYPEVYQAAIILQKANRK